MSCRNMGRRTTVAADTWERDYGLIQNSLQKNFGACEIPPK